MIPQVNVLFVPKCAHYFTKYWQEMHGIGLVKLGIANILTTFQISA